MTRILRESNFFADPSLERSFKGHKDGITSLAFKPSMTQLASGSLDCTVMVWNFKPGMRPYRFIGHKAPVTSIDFSPSGNVLASASKDKTVRIWTPTVCVLENHKRTKVMCLFKSKKDCWGEVSVFTAHTAAIRGIKFSSDGKFLLTCSDDKSIKLWSSVRPKFLLNLTGHLNWVRSAVFSPDATLVASGSDDKSVKLWDIRSKSCIRTYQANGMAMQIDFHEMGNLVGAAVSDVSVKIWDLRMHKLVQHYPDIHEHCANSIAFGSNWMVTTGGDGLVRIWDIKKGYLMYTLHGHQVPTITGIFAPESDYFASADQTGHIFVWKSNLLGENDGVIPHNDTGINISNLHEEKAINLGPVTFSEAKHISATRSGSIIQAPIISSPLASNALPVNLSVTLETIISQLDVLTATMNIIERRLTLCEDRLGSAKLKVHEGSPDNKEKLRLPGNI